MLKQCPSGVEWDRYVLDPAMPNREAMTSHLTACPYCRIVLAELQSDWTGLSVGRPAKQPTIFILVPVPEVVQAPRNMALAAKGEEPKRKAPKSLTLATEDHQMWLKAVRDTQSGDLWVYLYSEEEGLIPRNAVVRPFGIDRDYLTDEQGRINLGPIDWPERLSLRAEVRLPRASFRLAEVGELDRPAGEAVLASAAGDRLKISWVGEAKSRRITLDLQVLAGIRLDTPIQIAIRARGQDAPVQVRSWLVEQPLSLEHPGSLDRLEIFVYQ